MTIFKMIRELKRVNLHQITNTYSTETIFKIIGVYVTPLFIYIKCSANTATVIALIVGLSAGITHIIFGYESYHICISLFLLSYFYPSKPAHALVTNIVLLFEEKCNLTKNAKKRGCSEGNAFPSNRANRNLCHL